MPLTVQPTISVIVPTIGRPRSLERLLESLAAQTVRVSEVVVADGSGASDTQALVCEQRWPEAGLRIRWIAVTPPSAARQRVAAIREATGSLLLLLDDDVVLEPVCVEAMLAAMASSDDVVAVFADITNARWPGPTRAWRLILRHGLGVADAGWQGRVLGPLLRFGFNPVPPTPRPIEWIGAGNSLVRRSAYERVGGFSSFFLNRSSINEDVDLGLRLAEGGQILFCPGARMEHHQASEGRVSVAAAAEDDLYNRFWVLHLTRRQPRLKAFAWVALFVVVETASNLLSATGGRKPNGDWARFRGRASAIRRLLLALPSGRPAA